MKISFILLLFVSTFCFAGGGSIVRNGGGLGEMSAVLIFQKMKTYLNPCLQAPSACDLTKQELALIEKVSQAMPLELKSYQLKFYSKSAGPDLLTEDIVGSPIALRSGALASSDGNPNSFSEIGSLVLCGLLKHHGVDSMALARKVFSAISTETMSFIVNSNLTQIHWMRNTSSHSVVFDELVLEQPEESFDLFPLLTQFGLCKNSESLNLRIQRLFLPYPMAKTVVLDVNWNCGGPRFGRAKIEIELSFTDNEKFDATTTKTRAFGVLNP